MQLPKDKILIYQWRTVSQRIEAVFDFLRLCRKGWFLSVALLILPISLVLTSSVFFSQQNFGTVPSEWFDMFFNWESDMVVLFTIVALLGVWAMHIHVYSLLAAYEDNGFSLDDISVRRLLPYMRTAMFPSLKPTLLFILVIVLALAPANFVFFLFVMALTAPLSLFAPVYMIERPTMFNAMGKAVRMGFSSWIELVFGIVMVMVFGVVMLLSVNVPWLLARAFFDSFSSSGQEWGYIMLYRFVGLLLSGVAYLSIYLVGAMVLLFCVYHYGHQTELRGDGSHMEKAISNFDKL